MMENIVNKKLFLLKQNKNEVNKLINSGDIEISIFFDKYL